jgi:hypothetical protein
MTIPASVTSIGNWAFYLCNNLKTVTLSRRTRIGTEVFPYGVERVYSD